MLEIPTYEKLRAMSDEELVRAFNMREGGRITAEFIRQEIALREQERHTQAMLDHTATVERLTRWIAGMTLVVTIATIVNLVLELRRVTG